MMRSEFEIQRAHDLLANIIDKELYLLFPRGTGVRMAYAVDVLAWVLGKRDTAFERWLVGVERIVREIDLILTEAETHEPKN
jgi:hypothetical protein